MNTYKKTEEDLYNDLMQELEDLPDIPNYTLDRDALWNQMKERMAAHERTKRNKRITMYRYSAAASALLILSLFFLTNKPKDPPLIGNRPKVEQPSKKTITPQNITKDPVINVEKVKDPNPSKNLAQQTNPRTNKETKDTRYQANPFVIPSNDPVEPQPVMIAHADEPLFIYHPNQAIKRNKKPVLPEKYEGGFAANLKELAKEQSGFAFFKNP